MNENKTDLTVPRFDLHTPPPPAYSETMDGLSSFPISEHDIVVSQMDIKLDDLNTRMSFNEEIIDSLVDSDMARNEAFKALKKEVSESNEKMVAIEARMVKRAWLLLGISIVNLGGVAVCLINLLS